MARRAEVQSGPEERAQAFAAFLVDRTLSRRRARIARSASTVTGLVALLLCWAAIAAAYFAGPDAPVLVLSLGLSAVAHALLALALDRSKP